MSTPYQSRRSQVAIAGVLALALALATAPAAADPITFEGRFHWTGRDRRGDLKAVFTPTAESAWDVVFYFDWEDEPHVYSGTAEGSLSDGKLSGVVHNENKEYKFTFSGRFNEDKFEGTHQLIAKDGKAQEMGTLVLAKKSPFSP